VQVGEKSLTVLGVWKEGAKSNREEGPLVFAKLIVSIPTLTKRIKERRAWGNFESQGRAVVETLIAVEGRLEYWAIEITLRNIRQDTSER